MGLFDEDKTETKPPELDAYEIAYEKEKAANRSVIIGSLIFSFIIGFAVAEIEKRSILDPFMQRLSAAIGTTVGVLLFAGIPSAIAAKFTTKWRYVWLGITILLLVSQIVVFFYEKK